MQGGKMGSPDMTSVSVSFEVRRQLNSMRALGNYKSVDDLILQMLKEHRLSQIKQDSGALQAALGDIGGVDVDALVQKLGLSPFKE
jgi:Arc/MetJ-type ribon-helix-helix transcriptional regulator